MSWIGWIWLTAPAPVGATQWHLVASEDQNLQQQFVDLDSIQDLGHGRARVNSYYLDRRSNSVVKTTYVTDYDCPSRQFRDVVVNAPEKPMDWQPLGPDPLNRATMEFTCGQVGYRIAPSSQSKN
ncbi:MAG TPA: hypothetical protein IGR64_16130 [Leptolyngbyaceae cyanobacterium M65_K2018_010]|nr:hypothetical protein [Leptolyngbyaceae cyanobacterium M65_K2018_010]